MPRIGVAADLTLEFGGQRSVERRDIDLKVAA
jgi:hypothetical protein